jgi:hypothetical protein
VVGVYDRGLGKAWYVSLKPRIHIMLTVFRFADSAIPQTKDSVVEVEEREAAASMHGYGFRLDGMHEGTRKGLSEELGMISTGLG